jgi:hypothetical protein
MAIIPSTEKFIGLSAGVDTTEKRSSLINSQSQAYTMQDIADTVSSLSPSRSYGQISKMDSATITLVAQNEYQSTGLTGVLNSLNSGVSLGEDDTFAIKNTSGETKIFQIFGSIDMGVSVAGDTIMGIKFALNGVEVDDTECRAWSIGGKAGKLVTNWIFELEPDDEVALYVANFSNTNNISFSRGRIVAQTV